MEKKGATRRAASAAWSGGSARLVLLMTIAMLVAPATAARAQFNSGSSGVHGAFPPAQNAQGDPVEIPDNYAFLVWNVRTGGVRYCGSYTPGTGLDTCNVGSNPDVSAQIPGIPQGGLTTGVYEFTSFAVNNPLNFFGRQIVVVGATPNTPLSILSQTDITLSVTGSGSSLHFQARGWDGRSPGSGDNPTLNIAVAGGRGGPGGFDGGASGNGGATPSDGSTGLGPQGGAGGQANGTPNESLHALAAQSSPLNPSLVPLAGGSGGGGAGGVSAGHSNCGPNVTGYAGGSGGGGGGALLLAATGTVSIGPGVIMNLHGGNGGRNNSSGCAQFGSGGAGGSLRVVATFITGTGTVNLGGGVRLDGVQAGGGFLRMEATSNTYTGGVNGPPAGGSFVSFPTAPIPSNLPVLRITSVAGTATPVSPQAALATPDVTFETPIESPVTLQVAANNVPVGTTVNIKVVPAVGSPTTATTTPLAGTNASSTADATVTLPPGAGVITASASFNVSSGQTAGLLPAALPLIDGERAELVEVVAGVDGSSRTYLVAKSGARFELGRRSSPGLQ